MFLVDDMGWQDTSVPFFEDNRTLLNERYHTPKYKPLVQDSLQMMLDRYMIKHILVGHTIFKDISTFYNGKVIAVNVDNKENRKKKRGRAVLIDNGVYYVVGDDGVQRKL
jgi:hypothetical protein